MILWKGKLITSSKETTSILKFKILFLTNSITRQYSINYITNKNDNKNNIAASLTTYYFLYNNLQMSFQPLDLFKILIVIVFISIGVLRRSFVNT